MAESLINKVENVSNDIILNNIIELGNISTNNNTKSANAKYFSNIINNMNAETQKTQTNFVDKAVKSNTSSINKKAFTSSISSENNNKTAQESLKTYNSVSKQDSKQDISAVDNKIDNTDKTLTNSTDTSKINLADKTDTLKANDSTKYSEDNENDTNLKIDSFAEPSPVFLEKEPENTDNNTEDSASSEILDMIGAAIGIDIKASQSEDMKLEEITDSILSSDLTQEQLEDVIDIISSNNDLTEEQKDSLMSLFEKHTVLSDAKDVQKDKTDNTSFEKIKNNTVLDKKIEQKAELKSELKALLDKKSENNSSIETNASSNGVDVLKNTDTLKQNTDFYEKNYIANNDLKLNNEEILETKENSVEYAGVKKDEELLQNTKITLDADNNIKDFEYEAKNDKTSDENKFSGSNIKDLPKKDEFSDVSIKESEPDNKISDDDLNLDNNISNQEQNNSNIKSNEDKPVSAIKENKVSKEKNDTEVLEDEKLTTDNKNIETNKVTEKQTDNKDVYAADDIKQNKESTIDISTNVKQENDYFEKNEVVDAKETVTPTVTVASNETIKKENINKNTDAQQTEYFKNEANSETNQENNENEKINANETLKSAEEFNQSSNDTSNQNFENMYKTADNKIEYDNKNNESDSNFEFSNTDKMQTTDKPKVKTDTETKTVENTELEENLEKVAYTQEILDDMMISMEKVTSNSALTVADEVTKLALEENGSINSSKISGNIVYDSIGQNFTVKNMAFAKAQDSIFSQLQQKLETSEILNQIGEKLTDLKNSATQKLTMVLRPNDLGRLSIALSTNKEGLTTNIIAQNEDVRRYIEKNIDSLRKQLVDAGINVNNIQIKTAGQEGSTNYSGNGSQNTNESGNNQNQNKEQMPKENHQNQQNKNENKEILSAMSNYDYSFSKDFSSVLNKTISYGLS